MWKTEQEKFWAEEFGDAYRDRNRGKQIVAGNVHLFSTILGRTGGVGSCLELGANIGLNQQALRALLPEAELSAVEINAAAVKELEGLGIMQDVYNESLLEFTPPKTFDLVFTKGVLIHIAPDALAQAYKLLYEASRKYVLVVEYYNPSPVGLSYRGHEDRLFKRDFAGELMDAYADLRLVDYGFVYHRDPVFPADDLTWFLMEKQEG